MRSTLYIIRGNSHFSQAVCDTSFPLWLESGVTLFWEHNFQMRLWCRAIGLYPHPLIEKNTLILKELVTLLNICKVLSTLQSNCRSVYQLNVCAGGEHTICPYSLYDSDHSTLAYWLLAIVFKTMQASSQTCCCCLH